MRKVILGIFILISLLIYRPIMNNLWYPMHDSTHVSRAYLLGHSLMSAQVPAIWASEIGDGQGYPLFHFYAPLMTYSSLALSVVTGSYFFGIKLTLLLSSILGMIGMYLLTRRWGRTAGLVASIAYALLPYTAVNLYVRGAFAEYLAMGLLPWVFYSWRDLSTTRLQLRSALITTLFLLSHNLIPLITFPFLVVWIWLHPPTRLTRLILPALITIALSSFYLLPLLFERHFVMADTVARTTLYSLHFVEPAQLWNSVWGYGGSASGVEDGMSFKVGKLHLLLAIVASALIIIRAKRREMFFVFAGLVALFMTTSLSSYVWGQLPVLSIVQFPWRFLVLGGFFVSILAGYSITLIHNQKLQTLLGLIIIILLCIFNLKYFVPLSTFKAVESDYTNQSFLNTLPSTIKEYEPRWSSEETEIKYSSTITHYLYYPTWEVRLDGRVVPTYPANGYLAFDNPTDSSNYVVRQSHTQLENFASLVSLITLIIVVKIYVKN